MKKFVSIVVPPVEWAKFTTKIAKESEKAAKDKGARRFTLSSAVSALCERYLHGSIVISMGEPEKSKIMRGINIDLDLWKKLKNHLVEQEVKGKKIIGGFSGLITALIKQYNNGKVELI